MSKYQITTCISSFNNLNYLKLAIKSVRQNAFYNDMPINVHAENCIDGTNEWLEENKEKLNLTPIIETNEVPRGIGGGMDICVANAETEFVNIIHEEMLKLPKGRPANQPIDITYSYDESGKMHCMFTDVESGNSHEIELTPETTATIDDAKKQIEKISIE